MDSPQRIRRDDLFATLPAAWPDAPLPAIAAAVRARGEKVVVLDDDPTGTQTVHGVPVLTAWSAATLRAELLREDQAVFLLTNSRSLPLAEACALNAEIGALLRTAARSTGRGIVIISRSDSTLRGHYPGEVEALAQAAGGGFAATLIVPAFFPGGRYTIGDAHYVAEGDWLIPAGETPFAQDASFGYRASNLRQWVAEKTGGHIPAAAVASVSIETIRNGGPDAVTAQLAALEPGSVAVINAATERDLAVATLGIIGAEQAGQRFLYRTAASIVPLRAAIPARDLLDPGELALAGDTGGLIVVGSHVPRTSEQLAHLREQGNVLGVEVNVRALLGETHANEVMRAAAAADEALQRGQDVVLFTSREVITGADAEASLTIARRVSDSLIAILHQLTTRPRYLLAKGGITSSDVATKALRVQRAQVVGQILPGVPVWALGEESRWPGLPYVVFPGNVGGPDAVTAVVTMFKQHEAT